MRGAPHENWLRPFPVWRILLISVAEETGEQACVGRGCLRVEKIKYFFKWANPDLFLIYFDLFIFVYSNTEILHQISM